MDRVLSRETVPFGHPPHPREVFSFRGAMDRMLTMALLNLPATGGLCTKTTAREVGQKRIKRVSHWFSKTASAQALRRDSLVLQLTSVMETFMSTNPKEGDPPARRRFLQEAWKVRD